MVGQRPSDCSKQSGFNMLYDKNTRVVVVKLQQQKRCYILPTRLAKDVSTKKFSILNEPLSEALMKHFAGKEGLQFCANIDGYLLEEVLRK
uniref:Myosin motor domain-containing protein n=1 Tax=Heterorhabditis bacteriophora TaxID=37862 RepID=A0A1I7WQ51_HETBA